MFVGAICFLSSTSPHRGGEGKLDCVLAMCEIGAKIRRSSSRAVRTEGRARRSRPDEDFDRSELSGISECVGLRGFEIPGRQESFLSKGGGYVAGARGYFERPAPSGGECLPHFAAGFLEVPSAIKERRIPCVRDFWRDRLTNG